MNFSEKLAIVYENFRLWNNTEAKELDNKQDFRSILLSEKSEIEKKRAMNNINIAYIFAIRIKSHEMLLFFNHRFW